MDIIPSRAGGKHCTRPDNLQDATSSPCVTRSCISVISFLTQHSLNSTSCLWLKNNLGDKHTIHTLNKGLGNRGEDASPSHPMTYIRWIHCDRKQSLVCYSKTINWFCARTFVNTCSCNGNLRRYKKVRIHRFSWLYLSKAVFSSPLPFTTVNNFYPTQDLHVLKKLLFLHCSTVPVQGAEREHRVWKAHARLE